MTQEGTRRLAAVWFADIVGFTELSARDEDLALRVVRELQRIARMQCDARGGRLVKLLGDAVLTVFDSADGAVRAAVGLRDAFLQSPEVQAAGVSVRIGLHLGDVAESVDGDIYGDAVNAASRIEGMAEAGQVVISGVAYQLLQQRATLEVEDLGEHDLKGLGRVQLYAASISGDLETANLKELLQNELAPLQMLEMAGLGGMGEIYLARDPRLRRTLAVKVLRSELVADKQARARFFREAQVIAGLSHPNIIAIHSVGELKDGTPYFVMDYVDGGSLEDRLQKDGPFSVRATKRIIGEVASALSVAHAKGVVHRDIKASNVLFDSNTGRALVTDWGIAALDATASLSPDRRLTQTGAIIGSPQFMSPEQLAGDDVGPETDVYSLGLLAYELLTGQGPFEAETPRALMIAHLREEPTPLAAAHEGVDPELESVIGRCLAKTPRDRPSAEDIAGRFAPGAEAVLEWPPPGLEPLIGSVFKYQVGWGLLGLVVALPVFLAFAARVPWDGQDEIRSLLQGELGIFLLFAAVYGLGSVVLMVQFISERQSVTVGSGAVEGIQSPASKALQLGHGWRTIWEVCMDRWGDFGNLLAGQREYAILDDEERARVRRRIMLKGILFTGLSTLFPFAVMVAAAAISGRWMPMWMIGSLCLGVPGVVFTAALILPTDPKSVRRARSELTRGRSAVAVHQSEVLAWQESRGKATGGAVPPAGRPVHRHTWWVAQGVQAVLSIVITAYLLASLTTLAVGQRFNVSQDQLGLGDRFKRLSATAQIRLEADARTSPSGARALVDSIESWDMNDHPWQRGLPSDATPEASQLVHPESALGFVPDRVIPEALRGVSPQELAYLGRFEGDPRLDWFARLARAEGYDPNLVDSYPEGIRFKERAYRSYAGVREVAASRLATAGHLVARGQIDAGERALREVYSVGYLIAVESNDVTEASIGRSIATMGLDGLQQLYVGLGRYDEAAGLTETSDLRPTPSGWAGWVESAQGIVADSMQLRSVRLLTMHELVLAYECSSLEGLILGVPPDVSGLVSETAESLVRYPSDAVLVEMASEPTRRVERAVANASPDELRELLGANGLLPFRMVGATGRLVANPRFATCLVLAGL